jgi:branched-chain amino acid aminotransferase
MKHFIFDGKLLPEGAPVVGPPNRGLRYGDGLFETIKCADGQLLMADEHFARLWKGMQVLQFDIPKHFTPEDLAEKTINLCRKNGHERSARVRITVLRGDGGLYDAANHFPHYIIETSELPQSNGEWNSNGLVLGIYSEVRKSNDILANLKHNNFLPYLLAALHAKKQQWNDALVLNSEGRICDSTIANIFMIRDENIYTPPLSEACIAGVMRRSLIKALATTGYSVNERQITVEELALADEVFLTNSIYNLRWVQRIGETVYKNSFTHKIHTDIVREKLAVGNW